MLRRSFRLGLWLGLLGGAAVAVMRALQRRPEPVAAPWPPAAPWPSPSVPNDAAAPEPRVVEPAAPEIVEPEPATAATPPTAATAATPAKAARKATKAAPRAAKVAQKAAATTTAPATTPAPEPEAAPAPWVDPEGGICPTTHPVKAKLASQLFHLPGMFNYERTKPDRCYRDEAAAEADGLRKSKR